MADEKVENIYTRGDVREAESRRLQKFDYPTEKSLKLLGDMKGRRLLDVGSGPGTQLKLAVEAMGGNYISFDVREDYLREQNRASASKEALLGSVLHLPVASGAVDDVHERFVLMHLPEEARSLAIEEILRVASERAIFMEFDWSSVAGNYAVNRFRDISLAVLPALGVSVYCGRDLKQEVGAAVNRRGPNLEVTEERFHRDSGDYKELINLGNATKGILSAYNTRVSPEQQISEEEIDGLIQAFDQLSKEENPEAFVPADIVGVVVNKKLG